MTDGGEVARESRPLARIRTDVWPVLGLIALAGLAWVVTIDRMQGMDMGPGTDLGGLGWFVGVWAVMMAAMMLPSLSPMAVAHSRAGGGAGSVGSTLLFAAGYLLVWIIAGLLAYALVEGVRPLDLGFLGWDEGGRYVAGGVITGAALYEFTPMKRRCLRHCRDSRLLRHRPGAAGAIWMGLDQGGFCVGCSWALMTALFALGVMSIAWMVVIAALIAIEKLLPSELPRRGATAAVLVLLGIGVAFFPDQVPGLTIPTETTMDAMSM